MSSFSCTAGLPAQTVRAGTVLVRLEEQEARDLGADQVGDPLAAAGLFLHRKALDVNELVPIVQQLTV